MRKRVMIPTRWIRVDNVAGTTAIRGPDGRLEGRKRVRDVGDKTTVRRVTQDVDVNHDGKVDFFGGTIYGRTRKPTPGSRRVVVKASSRAKGYERRL